MFCLFSYIFSYKIPSSANFRRVRAGGCLGVKTCEVFLCFLAIIFLGPIVLTSLWLLCIHCFTSLVSFTGLCTDDEPRAAFNLLSQDPMKPILHLPAEKLKNRKSFTHEYIENESI